MKEAERSSRVNITSALLQSVLQDFGYSFEEQKGIMIFLAQSSVNDSEEKFASHAQAAQWLLSVTQKYFLRRGERWSTENKAIEAQLSHQRDSVLEGAQLLGLMTKEVPGNEILVQPHISILPGALEKRVIQRIESIVDEIKQTGKLPELVIAATGYRALNAEECIQVSLSERTEEQMILYQWQQASQKYPVLARIPFYVSCAPLKAGQTRSTTEDTVAALKTDSILSQYNTAILHVEKPYSKRFNVVFSQLPISLELYAQACLTDEVPLFTYQDEIARSIYFSFPRLQEKYSRQADGTTNQDNNPRL